MDHLQFSGEWIPAYRSKPSKPGYYLVAGKRVENHMMIPTKLLALWSPGGTDGGKWYIDATMTIEFWTDVPKTPLE